MIMVRLKGTDKFVGKREPTYALMPDGATLNDALHWFTSVRCAATWEDEGPLRRLFGRAAQGNRIAKFSRYEVLIIGPKKTTVVSGTKFYRNTHVRS